ncbi:MAG: amidohydrolase family protein [Synergistales bacterium]|nr:amidohydrolase family protein [Synergistales bacterium]
MAQRKVDTVVAAPHVMTMQGSGVGYRADHALAIEAGKIVAVGKREDILAAYLPERCISRENTLLLPGFVDAHCHFEISVLRGLAQDTADWMMSGLVPFARHLQCEDRRTGFLLGVMEALAAGTTTICNFDNETDDEAAAVERIGIRGQLTQFFREVPDRVYAPGELYEIDRAARTPSLEEVVDLFDRWHGKAEGRIRILFGPMAPDFVSAGSLQEIQRLAKERHTLVHLHVAQGDRETYQMVQRYGRRTIPWLAELGLLDESLIAVHLTDATDEETRTAAGSGASMVLCSNSIGIIDGLVPPAKVFQDAGGVVGLGSDQAPGNNNHNMFSEMKATALFNKIKFADPEAMPAWQVLRMATVEGAQAIGLGESVGSLEEGKRADYILVDLDAPSMMPVHTHPMRNLVPNLVYGCRGDEVVLTAVDDRILYEKGRYHTLDPAEVRGHLGPFAGRIGRSAEPDFRRIGGTNRRFMEEGKL